MVGEGKMMDLRKLWAKSDGTTLREHTDKLLENLRILRELYGDLIEKTLEEDLREDFWKALELACEYHDYGKAHSWFQKKVGNPEFKNFRSNFPEVRHNLISPAFLPEGLSRTLGTLVSLVIVHHHDYEPSYEEAERVKEVLRKEFGKEMSPTHRKALQVREEEIVKRLEKETGKRLSNFYTLLKGFLFRIDHGSSSRWADRIETEKLIRNEAKVRDYLKGRGSNLNDLQEFVLRERESNLLVIASTGYGKTEAGFIFLKDKGFFTIPIRTSANAIYERAKDVFGEGKVGLLHSTASLYLVENSEKERNFQSETFVRDLFLTKNFAKPLIVSTPDQLFPFILRPKGFEKYFSLFSYARVVIDEVQLFEPHTLGFLVKAIEKAHLLGGRVMVMTATLPSYVREDLRNIEFKEAKFLSSKERHHVKVMRNSILSEEGLDLIKKLSREGKVLVITNTRRRALELRKSLEKGEVFHAYFIHRDRRKKEKEIKDFFDKESKGVWITTQIAEVSLDLDADFLVTELSTADSLFQRMGRVNRKGKKPTDEPNVFLFTEECSGIGSVYRKSIYKLTKEFLIEGVLSEEEKPELVERVYSLLKERDREYIEKYEEAKRYIDSLWEIGESFNKKKAQELFRDLMSVTVIPEEFRDEVEELISAYREENDPMERLKYFSKTLGYTFSYPAYELKSFRKVEGLRDVFWISGNYSQDLGFACAVEGEEENIV